MVYCRGLIIWFICYLSLSLNMNLLWSYLLALLWYYIFSGTILSIIQSDLFNMILLLLSNLSALIKSTHICSLWYYLIQSDPIQSNLIFSFFFDPLTLLCSDSVYSDHYKSIQSSCSLFPSLLYLLRSTELLILPRITYHYDPSNLIITCTKV